MGVTDRARPRDADLAPIRSALLLDLRAESRDGLSLLALTARGGSSLAVPGGAEGFAEVVLAAERVVLAVNDRPVALYAEGAFRGGASRGGAEVGWGSGPGWDGEAATGFRLQASGEAPRRRSGLQPVVRSLEPGRARRTGPGYLVATMEREGIGYFARFGVTERMIRETLTAALSRGGDHADVFFQHRVASDVGLEDGAVNRAHASVELGVGVRVVKGDQTGYGYTEDLSAPALLETARTAAAIADGPSRPGPVTLHVGATLPDRYPLVRPWEEVPPAEKLPLLSSLNERAFAADPRVRKVNVYLRDESGAILVADSSGRIVEDAQPMTLLYLSLLAEDGGRREQNGYNVAGRAGFDFYTPERLDRVVREAVGRTTVLFEAISPPAGEMPVVLAAGSSGILLHEAIGHGMEADFNRKGVSIYADKIGKRIAQPFVNIVDDAANPGARGAINVDDEGNEAGTTRLVEDGVLATYLHDAISARHYGVRPTGNGRRESYRHPPLPRMRSTYMLPGPHRTEEIIRSVKRGIYCQNFSNGQVNIGAGDFTFYVKNGFLIEDGKLTRPVKDVNIIGNGPDALLKVDMVSDDLAIDEGGWTCGKDGQSVPVSQGLPTVRVSSLTVGGRG